jgi:hypothetical protein
MEENLNFLVSAKLPILDFPATCIAESKCFIVSGGFQRRRRSKTFCGLLQQKTRLGFIFGWMRCGQQIGAADDKN